MGAAGGDEENAVKGSESLRREPNNVASTAAEPPGLLRRAGEILERRLWTAVLSEPKREIGEDIIVLAGGNLANAYFRFREGKATLPELGVAYPDFVDSVVRHSGVDFVLAHGKAGDPVMLGKPGRRDVVHGQVHAEDPLIVNSTLYEDGRVAAFEELIGSHGELGGAQAERTALTPARKAILKKLRISGPAEMQEIRPKAMAS